MNVANSSLRHAAAFAILFFALLAPAARAQTATAVEFYHAGLDHYFLTHVSAEIALLDGGTTIKGWSRTGQSFAVYTSAGAGTSPVCRYYIPPAKGDSHFYGRGTAECNATGAANPTFVNEDPQFFHVVLPAAGVCPAGTRNVYRVFSNRADANHRYMVDITLRDQMVGKGWVAEGDGPLLVVMCAPGATAVAAAGIWVGTTDRNESVRAVILEDGTYYILYSRPGITGDWGVFQGSATVAAGTIASADAMNYPVSQASLSGREPVPAALTGTYVAKDSLQLAITDTTGTRILTAAYAPGSDQPANPAPAAGRFGGYSGHAPGRINISLTLDAAGKITGANELCTFAGNLVPRGAVGVFDLSIRQTSGSCAFGETASGILIHDAATAQIRAYAPFFMRSDLYYFVATLR